MASRRILELSGVYLQYASLFLRSGCSKFGKLNPRSSKITNVTITARNQLSVAEIKTSFQPRDFVFGQPVSIRQTLFALFSSFIRRTVEKIGKKRLIFGGTTGASLGLGGFVFESFYPPGQNDGFFEGNFRGFGGVRSSDPFLRLMGAAIENNVLEIENLIKSGTDPNTRHPFGWTALHLAAYWGNAEVVEKLLDLGADVDILDEYTLELDPKTLSGLGVGSSDAFERLSERQQQFGRSLRPNVPFSGTTALHYAVLSNQTRVIQILLARGADPGKKNSAGHLPKDYATDQSIVKLLEDEGKHFQEKKRKRESDERRRYSLEMRLKENIIGQEGPINIVASAIRRKENGWYDEDHPLVFLFLGSSGIGKTELAKQVAQYLHKDVKKGFIRIDMSEYQQKHEVAKFIGSPPGYVGYEEGGQLTKKLKEFPNAVVLFDEIEKAHPDILTIMLQLFDEGRLTDGKGKTVECKDATFIMTSNLASEVIADHATQLRDEATKLNEGKLGNDIQSINASEQVEISRKFKDKIVQPILKRHFRRDEFLGRINEMVYFLPFSTSELHQLVGRELELWSKRAKDKHNVQLAWDPTVVDVLASGYNLRYGARSIKHEVERRVVNKLAAAYEKELIPQNSKVTLSVTYPSRKIAKSQEEGKQDDHNTAVIELVVSEGEKPFTTLLGDKFRQKLLRKSSDTSFSL